MNVDFYSCSDCGEARYEEYIRSCGCCGNSICSNCLVNTPDYFKGPFISHEMKDDIGELLSKHCPFCEGSTIDKDEFIEYLCKKLDQTKTDLENEFKETKENEYDI